MAINSALLIAAPVLQDYLVDKDTGFPLAAGIIDLYKDSGARQERKNWYYQTGIPNNYTYVALDNPMTLSSVGTIQDPDGNDVIPYFYPYNEDSPDPNNPTVEKYYIVVTSADDIAQFTRANFPQLPGNSSGPTGTNPTLRNYIVNNVFWRNAGSGALNSIDCTNLTNTILAPSQHDGFDMNLSTGMSDIRFIKDATGADDTITFFEMSTSALGNYVTPQYGLNFHCTSTGSSETVKYIQIPISLHLKSLQGVDVSVVIFAQNISGSPNNYIYLNILQYTGTSATSPSVFTAWGANSGKLTINDGFDRYVVTDKLPTTEGLVLSEAGDDAIFLAIKYPVGVEFNINICKPSFYLSDQVPYNEFDNYDQVNAIISSPRTGYIQDCIGQFYDFGWLPMNDGTIGSTSSNASTRANVDTWQLFKMIWTANSDVANQKYAPMFESTGATAIYGASAYADFTANRSISLYKSIYQVFSGNTSVIPAALVFTTDYATNNFYLTLSDTTALTNIFPTGTPVQFTNTGGALPSGFAVNTTYWTILVDIAPVGRVFMVASSIQNALNGSALNMLTNSTGTSSVRIIDNVQGFYEGEAYHLLTVAELASHSHHTFSDSSGATSENATPIGSHNSPNNAGTSSSTGGDVPHYNIQPTTYMNRIIKL